MKFNWDLILEAAEYGRQYEIDQAVKDYIPMDQIDPPLNEAEKEYYRTAEYTRRGIITEYNFDLTSFPLYVLSGEGPIIISPPPS